MEMSPRDHALAQRIGLASTIFPRKINKALIIGFEDKFDFDSAENSPLALVIDSSPESFMQNLPSIATLFELKNIHSYVLCMEMVAVRTNNSGPAKIETIPAADDQEVNNAMFYLVNLGDGNPSYFIRPDDGSGIIDLGAPINPTLGIFGALAPGDIGRKAGAAVVANMTPERRQEFLDHTSKFVGRTALNDTADAIRATVEQKAATVH